MDPFHLMSFALGYVALQAVVMMRFEGAWLRAAILPVPVMCAMLVVSVSLGLFGVQGADLGAVFVVPLGAIYLVSLILVHIGVRFVASSFSSPEEIPSLRTTLSKGQAERQRQSSGWLATAETID